MYFMSKVSTDAKTRYIDLERIALALKTEEGSYAHNSKPTL